MRAETNVLLNLSYAISNVRNKADLTSVINAHLKKLFDFENIVVLLLGEDGAQNSRVFSSGLFYEPRVLSEMAIAGINKDNMECLQRILDTDGLLVFNMEELCAHANCPADVHFEYEKGIREKIVIPLRKENKQLGVFCINSKITGAYSENDYILMKGVSYQLSTAVSNILANEDIQRREAEKSKLLAFSNAIASVRDKNKLAKLLKQQLNNLFAINEYVIHLLSPDKTKHSPVLFDPDALFAQHPDFIKMIGRETTVYDGIFNVIIASEEPVFFNLGDWSQLPEPPVYINAAKAEQLETMIGVPIRIGSECIAVMNFKHDNYDKIKSAYHLFKSILAQLAITVSNIAANEKIDNQLLEINNYKQQLEQEKVYLKEEIAIAHNYAEIIGDSPAIQKIFRLIGQVASADSTVLIMGETGTGKELVARAIHNNSPRKNKLMVKVNCAALPANLIESELFGHERGSFTGATDRRLGKFELANGGTLFLDEIGEMPLDLQVKLLRALQEREIERIGGKGTIKVDVRIIAATNRDLEKETMENRFRSDLYYRLNIFPIVLPSLRDRACDIPQLANYFINKVGKKTGRRIKMISNKAMQDIVQYAWPGNIRELEHLIERSILLTEGDVLKQIYLPSHGKMNALASKKEFIIQTIDEMEKEHIMATIGYCKGRVGGDHGAAALLGVPPSTLFSKMKKLGLQREITSAKY